MPAFELRLPAMVVGVDKARTYDLVGAINDLAIVRWFNVMRNFQDLALLNQEIGRSWDDVAVRIMNENGAILQKDTS
jgi:hypothetical protein